MKFFDYPNHFHIPLSMDYGISQHNPSQRSVSCPGRRAYRLEVISGLGRVAKQLRVAMQDVIDSIPHHDLHPNKEHPLPHDVLEMSRPLGA
jgi:hypothetical protein